MRNWIMKARRLACIIFQGRDPVVRAVAADGRRRVDELREMELKLQKAVEQDMLEAFRDYNQHLQRVEQVIVDSEERSRKLAKRLAEEAMAVDEGLSLTELHTWAEAVKAGDIPFDLNVDIRASLEQLKKQKGVGPGDGTETPVQDEDKTIQDNKPGTR